MKKAFSLIAASAAIALLGAGCAPYNAPTAPAVSNNNAPPVVQNDNTAVPPVHTSAKTDVSISNFSFNPGTVTINKGMTVVWTNNDSVGHTITADQGAAPASGVINQGETYAFTFNTPGTFSYHCSVHPSMKGTVVVNP